jgi:hypothetical protein
MIILKGAVEKESFRNRLVTIFHDKQEEHVESLKKNISQIPNITSLKYEP